MAEEVIRSDGIPAANPGAILSASQSTTFQGSAALATVGGDSTNNLSLNYIQYTGPVTVNNNLPLPTSESGRPSIVDSEGSERNTSYPQQGVSAESRSLETPGYDTIGLVAPNATSLRPFALKTAGPTVYTRLMIREHGLPMWMPVSNFPESVSRTQGITPGDVGVLAEGTLQFRYLFNIWDDEAQLGGLADPGLAPFYPPPSRQLRSPGDIVLMDMGTIVEGAEEKRIFTNSLPPYCDLHYEWCQQEGAILVTPFGAKSECLTDRTTLDPFIKHNCRRLYQLAKNIGGLHRASLYIVTGCVKAAKWAIAAHRESTATTVHGAGKPPLAMLQNLRIESRGQEVNGFAWTMTPNGTASHYGPRFGVAPTDNCDQCIFITGYRLTPRVSDDPRGTRYAERNSPTSQGGAGDSSGPNTSEKMSSAGNSASKTTSGDTSGSYSTSGSGRGNTSHAGDEDVSHEYRKETFPHSFSQIYPSDCINELLSSSLADLTVGKIIEASGGSNALAERRRREDINGPIGGFVMFHDDLWTDHWRKNRPPPEKIGSLAGWRITLLKTLRALKKDAITMFQEDCDALNIMMNWNFLHIHSSSTKSN
ncbi:hypothetical protein FA15DRAFT_660064 [Coprinopsis marcescibilis]|uniref:Uncharacterized protein n=1 Tax=Coprinopsis marcescibilis TaxID=230819 RepID=A0A5C3KGE2_COPMA|nr:hypothetical protein FA15DRAFT_660064 [Coprinopsis marcescibilis]